MAATLAAAAGVIMLFVGLILYVYYYERYIDYVLSPDHDFGEFASLFDIAKASMYLTDFGQIAAVSALLMTIHGAMRGQINGVENSLPGRAVAANVKRLLLVTLVCVVIGTIALIYMYELQDNSGIEVSMRISSLYNYAPMLGWAIGTLALLLVANGLRVGGPSSDRTAGPGS